MRAGERGMRCDAIIGRSGSEGLTYFRHPSTSSSSFTKCSAQCTQWLVSQTCLQSCRDSVYTSRLAPPPNPFDFRSQDQVSIFQGCSRNAPDRSFLFASPKEMLLILKTGLLGANTDVANLCKPLNWRSRLSRHSNATSRSDSTSLHKARTIACILSTLCRGRSCV